MDPLGRTQVSDVAAVERELAELWSEASTEDQAVVRACTLNLVVACADGERELEEATRRVAGISATMPCRALVIAPSSAAGQGDLDVYVSAHCHRGAGGAQVCSEQITLRPRGAGLDLVPGTVLQLLVEELPVVTWWRRRELVGDCLLPALAGLSRCLLVDSADFDDPGLQLKQLDETVSREDWKGHGADVTWARLEPWREALASFFDAAAQRQALSRFTAVTVTAGGPEAEPAAAAALYLAGWLASRLGWRPGTRGSWRRRDGAPVRLEFLQDEGFPAGQIASARIETEHDGSRAAFVARRISGQSDFVLLSVETDDPGPPPRKIKLPARDMTALLCGTLQQADRDPVFASALRDAARMT